MSLIILVSNDAFVFKSMKPSDMFMYDTYTYIYIWICMSVNWVVIGLTHWGRVMHICVGKLSIIASDNGSSPGRRQAIIWTNAVILLVGHLGTNFSENWNGIETFSIKEMHLKMSSAKWRLFGLGLNELSNGLLPVWCKVIT